VGATIAYPSGMSDASGIRPLSPSDAESAARLWAECGLTRPWNDPEADFRRAVAGLSSAVLGLAGDEGGPGLAGTVMVGHDGHRGWMYYVAVARERRGKGLGRALVAAAEAWLAERGVPKAMLMVRTTNAGVLGFYERQGYARSRTVVLERRLS